MEKLKLNKKEVKEIFNSPSYKKWAKKMEEMYEELHRVSIWDFVLADYHEKIKMIAEPIKLTPSRKKGKER